MWVSADAVKADGKRAGLMGHSPNKTFYLGNDPLTAALYRAVGQRGPHPSRALIRPDHPSPEDVLAALVGPLAMFRWEDSPVGDEAHDSKPLSPPRSCAAQDCGDLAEPGAALCAHCASWRPAPLPSVRHSQPRAGIP